MVVRSKVPDDIDTACVYPAALDIAFLGFFLGLRVNELVVERGAAGGFRGMRENHGYVVQHLIESERSISELARRAIDVSLRRKVGARQYEAARSVLVACLEALGGLARVRERRIRTPR